MIRYRISSSELTERIDTLAPGWRGRAQLRTSRFLQLGRYEESSSIWSEVKLVYMTLQRDKCAYCEQRLEGGRKGTIAHDLEHFRPKASVRAWPSDSTLYSFATGDAYSDGYFALAYHPENYLTACKVCNSQYKSDYFPILGTRVTQGLVPDDFANEEPLLIYPLGENGPDPEDLLVFEGVEVKPRYEEGIDGKRGRVLIDFFELNREELQEGRAWSLLAAWFTFPKAVEGDALASSHLERLTSPQGAHTNCLRQFVRLCYTNQDLASEYAAVAHEVLRRSET